MKGNSKTLRDSDRAKNKQKEGGKGGVGQFMLQKLAAVETTSKASKVNCGKGQRTQADKRLKCFSKSFPLFKGQEEVSFHGIFKIGR